MTKMTMTVEELREIIKSNFKDLDLTTKEKVDLMVEFLKLEKTDDN